VGNGSRRPSSLSGFRRKVGSFMRRSSASFDDSNHEKSSSGNSSRATSKNQTPKNSPMSCRKSGASSAPDSPSNAGPPTMLSVSIGDEAVGGRETAQQRASDGSACSVDVSDASELVPELVPEETSLARRSGRLSREGDELKSPMMRQRMSFRASRLAESLDSLVEDPGDFSMV